MTEAITHWSARYVGIPWRAHGRTPHGFDCWGLVRAVYADQCGVELPSLADDYADPHERAEIAELIAGPAASCWVETSRHALAPFDLLLFGGLAVHVGVAIDAGRMLHVDRGRLSEIARLDAPRWRRASLTIGRHKLVGRRA